MNMKFPIEFPQYPVVRFGGKFLSLLIVISWMSLLLSSYMMLILKNYKLHIC